MCIHRLFFCVYIDLNNSPRVVLMQGDTGKNRFLFSHQPISGRLYVRYILRSLFLMKLSNLRFFCLADSQSNNPLTSEVLLYYSEKLILLFNPIF